MMCYTSSRRPSTSKMQMRLSKCLQAFNTMKTESKRKYNPPLIHIDRLERKTRQFFGEKVDFDSKINDKFEKQLQDIDLHFEEHEREDDKLDVNEPEVARRTIQAISSEFDKFNQDLRKKNKDNLTQSSLHNQMKLERSQSGHSLN